MTDEQKRLCGLLLDVARAAETVRTDAEFGFEDEDGVVVTSADYERLSEALLALRDVGDPPDAAIGADRVAAALGVS